MKKTKYLNRFTGLIPLLIWSIIFLFLLIFRIIFNPGDFYNTIIRNLFFSSLLLVVLFYLHTFLIYPAKNKKQGKWLYFVLLLGCFLTFAAVQRYLIPLPNTPGFWRTHSPGTKFETNAPRPAFIIISFGLAISGSFCYRLYLDKIKQSNFIKELEIIQLKTELDFLRSQISPHFMFNTMNTLVSMARKKSELMETSLISLSQLMRYMLYDSEGSRISLDKEIEYLKNYIDLQLLRFGDALRFNLFLSGRFEGYKIEPMLLMPFVENAFKHGIGNLTDPIIDVAITMDAHKQTLHMMIMNNVNNSARKSDKGSGIGLTNVCRRLELLYPQNHEFSIQQKEDVFIVILEIKL
jgi:two-component system LytT family sensor kinase